MNAGADQTLILPKNSITLKTKSSDYDGATISTMTYVWNRLAIGSGGAATLATTNRDSLVVSGMAAGTYNFRVLATAAGGATAADIVQVTVLAGQVPKVNAGKDKVLVLPINAINLSGSATDADGTIAKYRWKQVSGGSQASLFGDTTTFLQIRDLFEGSYQFALEATDNGNGIGKDTMKLTVLPLSDRPTAFIEADTVTGLSVDTVQVIGKGTGGKSSGNPVYRTVDRKKYELKDHLGNVRVVISDAKIATIAPNGTITALRASLQAYMNYYPFGMETPSGSWAAGSNYRFGFNGKERDPEFQNNYDYGMRIYNSKIGRFLSMDPLFKSFTYYSPYHFAGNTPIVAIDLDGEEIYFYDWKIKNENGRTKKEIYLKEKINDLTLKTYLEINGIAGSDINVAIPFPGEENFVAKSGHWVRIPEGHTIDNLPSLDDPIWDESVTYEEYSEGVVQSADQIIAAFGVMGVPTRSNKVDWKKINPKKIKLSKEFKEVLRDNIFRNARLSKLKSGWRPERFRKGVVDKAWANGKKNAKGDVIDPNTGDVLKWDKSRSRDKQWDMGHKKNKDWKSLWKKYEDGDINWKKLLDEYHNPNNYQPEAPSPNRSRKYQ